MTMSAKGSLDGDYLVGISFVFANARLLATANSDFLVVIVKFQIGGALLLEHVELVLDVRILRMVDIIPQISNPPSHRQIIW